MTEPLDGPWEMVLSRIDALAEDIKEIRTQTTLTNGRVKALELREAVAEAIRKDRAARLVEETQESDNRLERRMIMRAAMVGATPTCVAVIVAAVLHLHI